MTEIGKVIVFPGERSARSLHVAGGQLSPTCHGFWLIERLLFVFESLYEVVLRKWQLLLSVRNSQHSILAQKERVCGLFTVASDNLCESLRRVMMRFPSPKY